MIEKALTKKLWEGSITVVSKFLSSDLLKNPIPTFWPQKDNHLKTEVERTTTHLARKNPAAAHFCFWLERKLSIIIYYYTYIQIYSLSKFGVVTVRRNMTPANWSFRSCNWYSLKKCIKNFVRALTNDGGKIRLLIHESEMTWEWKMAQSVAHSPHVA